MFNMNTPSLADIAAVTRNNDNDGFGGNNGWWILIILFALFGWGNGGYGYGNGGGGCNCATSGDIQRGFDTQTVVNKLDGISNGLCSLGYDQLAQMNGINQNVSNTGFGIQNAITQMGIANMQDTNSLSRQLADCCCENRQAIAQVRYDMATDACATKTAINEMGQTIMQNDNANYRALNDRITQQEINALKERIAQQDQTINALNLAISQRNQTDSIVERVRTGCGCNACNSCG